MSTRTARTPVAERTGIGLAGSRDAQPEHVEEFEAGQPRSRSDPQPIRSPADQVRGKAGIAAEEASIAIGDGAASDDDEQE